MLIAWTLLALPFVSMVVIEHTPCLRTLTATHGRITWAVGVVGLALLVVGLVGLLSFPGALVVAILGGAVSGFSLFSASSDDSGGDGWRRWDPAPDDSPPPPAPSYSLDWERFDLLREQWERSPAHGR